MERDNQIFELIEQEHQRQLKGIELIAATLPTNTLKAIPATVTMAVVRLLTRLSNWPSTAFASCLVQSMPTYSLTLVPRPMPLFFLPY